MMNIDYCHCERQPKAKAKQSQDCFGHFMPSQPSGLLRALRALAMTIICALAVVCGLWSVDLCAQPISSTDLINNAKDYDGKTVTYEGEVIGDIMARGEYAWVNVSDDINAIGVWMPKTMTKDIVYSGSYNIKGDLIEVTGVFHRSCEEHGGDLDIHAENIMKIKDGYAVSMPLDAAKVKYAVLSGIILVLVGIWKVYTKFISG